jgi:hypothetical protein
MYDLQWNIVATSNIIFGPGKVYALHLGCMQKFFSLFPHLLFSQKGISNSFEILVDGGRAEGLECADLESRMPIGVSRINITI